MITNLFDGNEIYKEWSDMATFEYKEYKGIRKEFLRDNMTNIEVALTDLGEIATRELVKKYKSYGLKEDNEIVRRGENINKNTCDNLVKELDENVISNKNSHGYKYIDNEVMEQIK